jgi:formylglycine-generating enzyme required for sulfatase activity
MFLKELLLRTHQNLFILQEREAKAGGEARLELLNQIEDHHRAIELIQQALTVPPTELTLRQLKTELRSLLITINVEQIDLETLKLETPPLPFEPETIPIPAGPFWLGSDAGEVHEAPAHPVTLPAYAIGQYPITNAQYLEYVKQIGAAVSTKTGWVLAKVGQTPPADKLKHPVVGVSWDEAVAYCRWLSGPRT